MNRGDQREDIYRTEREKFLATLAEACEKTHWQIHALCLMSNQQHVRHLHTMRKQQEIFALREIERIYPNCPKQVAFYVGRKWMFLVIGWFLMFVAALLVAFEVVGGRLGSVIDLFIAALGGSAVGLAVLFSVAAKGIPYLVRHTALQEQEIRKRLEELNNA